MPTIHLNESAELIADRTCLTLTCISEMRGAYPDIPLPPDIDRAALGDDAFFVTLPLGQAGARSRNHRTYSRAAVEQMVAQVNERRPEGMWGHVGADEADTRYDPPAIRWLAASIDAEGVAWGKGLPLTAATREYYRLAKATNARVGTSLVAWAQMDGDEVAALELVTVDLADPARVGVPVTAARARISREMGADSAALSPLPVHVGEGQGEKGDTDPRVLELLAERDTLRESLYDAALTAAVNQAVSIPAARSLVLELVRARSSASPANPAGSNPAGSNPTEANPTESDIDAAVTAVVESAAVQSLLSAALAGMMGPAQRRPATRDGASSGFFEFVGAGFKPAH